MLPARLVQRHIYFLQQQKKLACGLVDLFVMVQAELEQDMKHYGAAFFTSEMEDLFHDMELRMNGFRSSYRRFVEKEFDACIAMWRSLV